MGKAIDNALFMAIKTQRKTRSPKQVAQAKHVSLATIERIDGAKTFSEYQTANNARYEKQRAKKAAERRKAAKAFNTPMRGTSPATIDREYKPQSPENVAAVKRVLGEPAPVPRKGLLTRIRERLGR